MRLHVCMCTCQLCPQDGTLKGGKNFQFLKDGLKESEGEEDGKKTRQGRGEIVKLNIVKSMP
jgi:hypothetical protein